MAKKRAHPWHVSVCGGVEIKIVSTANCKLDLA